MIGVHNPFRGYDAWLQHDPAMDEPDEQPVFRCAHCGAFLSHKHTRSEDWEAKYPCNGQPFDDGCGLAFTTCGLEVQHDPHDHIEDAGTTFFRTCRKCGEETRFDF